MKHVVKQRLLIINFYIVQLAFIPKKESLFKKLSNIGVINFSISNI